MAPSERKHHADLKAHLTEWGHKYSFFQAIKLLHRLSPHSAPLGELGPVAKEAIRLRHDPRLIFASGDVSSIREYEDGRFEVRSTFLGLTGASSPLATALCEDLARVDDEETERLRDFYDLFHHRLLSLFYRAWKKYRFAAGFRTGGADPFTRRALAFVGTDLWGSVSPRGLPPMVQLALAPVLSQRTRSARMLELLLARMFDDVPVRVISFIQRRVRIPDNQRVSLGRVRTTLNEDFTVGTHVIDQTGRFRVHVGPASYEICQALMPGGSHYASLRDVVAQFTRGILEAELEVELAEDASFSFQLGSESSATLGVSTRLPATGPGRERTRMRTLLTDDIDHPAVLV